MNRSGLNHGFKWKHRSLILKVWLKIIKHKSTKIDVVNEQKGVNENEYMHNARYVIHLQDSSSSKVHTSDVLILKS